MTTNDRVALRADHSISKLKVCEISCTVYTVFALQFDQAGLTFDRDHYLEKEKTRYHDAFVEYFAKIIELLGGDYEAGKSRASEIFEFETKLAKVRKITCMSYSTTRKP